MNATIAVPVWAVLVFFALIAGWTFAANAQTNAFKELFRLYREEREADDEIEMASCVHGYVGQCMICDTRGFTGSSSSGKIGRAPRSEP